jgi:hypothetical protein
LSVTAKHYGLTNPGTSLNRSRVVENRNLASRLPYNTHTRGAFYEAFPPEIARAYVKRIDFHYTPKHGSWLNVAECELSCLTSQCLAGRRIGELSRLQTEIGIWAEKTNAKQRAVDWQFKIDDARTKLKRLYPRIKSG